MEGLELAVVSEPTDALRSSVRALSARVEATSGHAPLSEHKRMVLARAAWGPRARPGRAGEAVAPGVTGGPDARPHDFGITATLPGRSGPAGYAQVSGDRGQRRYAVELLVDPDVDRPGEVAGALVGSTVEQVAEYGGGTVRLWVPQATEADDGVAGHHGFRHERDLIQMRCPLPLPAPAAPRSAASVGTPPTPAAGPALPLRPFRPGHDEEAWLVTNNRAFASHPEQGHWDLDTLLEREQEEWFDPDGFLLLEVDGRLAGSCWTKVHARTAPPMGEIYVIGVDPDFHGRGWGRRLTRAGLDWLAGQGLSVGMLYVDADNRAAVTLYGSMGFAVDHVDRSYVLSVGQAGASVAR